MSSTMSSSTRGFLLSLAGGVTMMAVSSQVSVRAATVPLVEDGAAQFVIVYAEKNAEVGEAIYEFDLPKESEVLARLVAEYVAKVTGAEVEFYAESDAPAGYGGTVLYIGATAKGTELVAGKGAMEEDEFYLAFPDADTILIAGQFQHGIEWGTYEFIERYLGVRWLFAGELGTHVPKATDIAVPRREVHQRPAYLSRALSFDNNRAELTEWSRLSRLRRRVRHGHYLGVLFHPTKFLESHPEFYPIQNGVRARPIDPVTFVAWQPCFTAPKIVETIAPHVAQFLRGTKPRTSTMSLGVNDNGGHCECERCLALDGNGKTPGGLANRSRSYYRFCNQLATEVHRLLPERKELRFGLLAYSNVIVPPEEALHPSLIPFLTRDRMLWADEETRQRGHAENEQWRQKASTLGWYDYLYGKYYSVPRVYFHTMQDYLQYGHANEVEHYYAEAYIADDYREGPKFWLTMKLLWDPELDIEAALDDWYTAAAGTAAAPFLRQYFARWERFWTDDIHDSAWFADMKTSTYCRYADTRYFSAISNQLLSEQKELLQAAQKNADSPLGKQRVQRWIESLRNASAIVNFRNAVESLNKPGSQFTTREVLSHDTFDNKDVKLEQHALGGIPTEGWSTWKSNYSKATLTTDPRNGVKGGALFIDKMADKNTPSPTGTVFMKRVPVKPDQVVRVTLRAKAEQHAAGANFDVTFRFQDDNSQWVDFMTLSHTKLFPIEREGEWHELSAVVPVPKREDITGLMVLLGTKSTNSGRFWFDEIRIDRVE